MRPISAQPSGQSQPMIAAQPVIANENDKNSIREENIPTPPAWNPFRMRGGCGPITCTLAALGGSLVFCCAYLRCEQKMSCHD
ncbi:hypothetical protein BOTBODRAFT_253006 [Botryobasidium botryosum FD-172 SS1]|uniref:Uncharacterized protein n=1 Tax=Botryobasidium botryosum (strain FD-172 SS1) TaxID=930990 RepID=A0A067MYG1_BOTB1|nr:hypothetical protein BOTBODRAFT_253006 [Botryobasidium botryosum FD-172 SS1]